MMTAIRPQRSEVFLSFRGKDTRQNFVGHLHKGLCNEKIQTFIDDRTERGSDISAALSQQITESQIAVIVVSKNYPESVWCLNELVMIMECHNRKTLKVLPVFYDVSPSDVRNLTGHFGKAFSIHKDSGAAALWEKTLCAMGNIVGWDLTDPLGSHQADCIDKIVQTVIQHLRSIGYIRDNLNLIGIDHRMRNVMTGNLSEHNVIIIGIIGMPGSGKTTVARAVYDDMCEQFSGHCFVHNISEVAKKNDLVFLQNQILRGVLGDRAEQVGDKYEGCKKIEWWLKGIKVLIVLDKVDSLEQLEALVGAPRWFGNGSRIIITTTDKRLLKAHKIINEIHEVILLNDEEAIQLLNSRAFESGIPTEAHKKFLERVIRYADGHPGALKCLASKLIGKQIHEWEATINSLAIEDMLDLNLTGLNDLERESFLDLACFFNGWIKDEVTDILDSCGLYPTSVLGNLEEKSLVTFPREFIKMHNLVLETGRHIVHKEDHDDPSRQSRLWHPEQVRDVIVENRGTEFIKAIVMSNPNRLHASDAFNAFRSMKKLRLLHGNTQMRVYGPNCVFAGWTMEHRNRSLNYIHCDLRWLKWLTWDYFDLESWPMGFKAKELVGLQMRYSRITDLCSGRGIEFLEKLKFLDLSFSKHLIITPNFECLPHLVKLNLEFCPSLFGVHPSIQDHEKLEHLNLRSCKELKFLPCTLSIKSLVVLNLSGCSSLRRIPAFVDMTNLLELYLSNNLIERLPWSIGALPSLIRLDIGNCRRLTSVPRSIWMLNNLAQIILDGCPVWAWFL